MSLNAIILNHNDFKENTLTNRFFKHDDITRLLAKLSSSFQVNCLGKSHKQNSINLVKWGNGKTKIMLWSQMHGDEATGTMALFDLFNFLQSEDELVRVINENCQLFFIPMVNPDGAAAFTRRNAQQIDINRDFLKEATAEAKILKQCRADVKPEFGFNLHDQTTLWSVTGSLKPATLSFLAPAFDNDLSIDQTRINAMHVVADMFEDLTQFLPGQIGLFDDEFEPRAFGDNFQKAGTSTILIEAGGLENDDEKQEIRKYYFGAILSGLISIAKKSYDQQHTSNYFAIPKNNKQIFHILINDVLLDGIEVSVGINYNECPVDGGHSTVKTYTIEDVGDLSYCDAYQKYTSNDFKVEGEIIFNQVANFQLLEKDRLILTFENGLLL